MAPSGDGSEPFEFVTERDPRLRYIIPGVVAVAFLMEQLDSTIIVTAIPAMARSLAISPLRMNLAITTYVLTLAMFIPVSGWFADRYGPRRIFACALIVFTIGSILCGAATSFGMLVATRAIQGFGGAMMTPVGRLILIRSFPRSKFVTAMTYMTLPAIIGPVIGPLLGGVLTTYLSWRWIFYVNIPFGIVGVLMALRYVEEVPGNRSLRFDFPGFLLIGGGFVFLQFGIENIGHPVIPIPAVVAILVVAVLLFGAFALYARRVSAPAVDLTLFRLRSFRIGTLAGGLSRIGFNGVPFLLPLMLQVGFGLSPVVSGSLTFASAGGAIVIRRVLVRLLKFYGFDRLLVASALLGAAVIAGFALIGPETPHWVILIYVLIFGLTRSGQFMSSNTLSYADTPARQLSQATSLGGVLQQLTVSFGVSTAATLLWLVAPGGVALSVGQFHTAFLLMALIPLISAPLFLFLKPEDGRQVSGHSRHSKEPRPPEG